MHRIAKTAAAVGAAAFIGGMVGGSHSITPSSLTWQAGSHASSVQERSSHDSLTLRSDSITWASGAGVQVGRVGPAVSE